jgi:hypothetical protein
MTTTTNLVLEVGNVVPVPINLSTATITVNCLILDQRQVYGRTEFKMAPVSGDGAAWVTEKSILDGKGAVTFSKAGQARHS